MKKLLLIAVFMLVSNISYAGGYHHKSEPSVTNITNEVKADDRNFYVPLEAEVNVTPKRFRRPWFQGIFSRSGVEVGGGEPVFFTGAVAKFDPFGNEAVQN